MNAPLLLLGDGWQNPTGLSRIARDLHGVLAKFSPVHVGFHPPGLPVSGGPRQYSWSHLGEDWGASLVVDWIAATYDVNAPGVLLVIWDPDRAASYVRLVRRFLPGWSLWGYFAVDGHDQRGVIGDPAAYAIHEFDRVLAYGSYGAAVLSQTRGRPVERLPHGHLVEAPEAPSALMYSLNPRFARAGESSYVIGCVATNQPRKDLNLFVETLAELRRAGENAYGWLHTDVLLKTWDIAQLISIHAMQKYLRVTTGSFSDSELWQLYATCAVTICVGRGEGFGYPIVESLAVGTPCLAMDYAGGVELTPRQYRYGWQGGDRTNRYAIFRPQAYAEQVAKLVMETRDRGGEEQRAYCKGSVAHLHWGNLEARWQGWVREGMEGL